LGRTPENTKKRKKRTGRQGQKASRREGGWHLATWQKFEPWSEEVYQGGACGVQFRVRPERAEQGYQVNRPNVYNHYMLCILSGGFKGVVYTKSP